MDPPAERLLRAAAAAVGVECVLLPDTGASASDPAIDTLVLSSTAWPPGRTVDAIADAAARGARVLVLGRLGTHPDARASGLQQLWAIEEAARASHAPALVLRFGPVLGPQEPLWRALAHARRLPRGGTKLVQPVLESDAVETLRQALAGEAAWEGWYEVAGPEPWTLAELATLARATGTASGGAWEPPLEEIEEHRLAEAGPWCAHFGITPRPLAEAVRTWSRAA